MIQLTEQQSADLRELAAREGASVAEMVRRAVDRILAESVGQPKKSRLDALTVAGLFDSGSPGIARQHDDELAAAYLADGSRPAQVG